MRSPSDETLDPQLEHELRMLEAELGPDLDALQPSLEQEFARNLDASAGGIRDRIESALTKFCQGTPAADDITLVIIKRQAEATEVAAAVGS